jgi:predicted NBD/HSP70 family sugar kinase
MNILFDIGGTRTRIAKSHGADSFDEPVIFETPKSYTEGIEQIKKVIQNIAGEEKIDLVVGGFAGPIDRKTSTIIASPNLPDWVEKPLKKDLEDFTHSAVYLENDSAMVGLGEALYGSGKGFPIVVYITISTGVGGARIVHGKIDERVIGFEPGHQIVDMDNSVYPDNAGHDLESMIGGRWVEARMGKKAHEITDEAFWDTIARILAVGLNNTIMHWSPDVVVLGGSMMKKIGVPIVRVEAHLRQMVKIYPVLPPIVKAEFEHDGGLYGALAYIKNLKS